MAFIGRRCGRRTYVRAKTKLSLADLKAKRTRASASEFADSIYYFTNHFIGRVHRARRRGWQWFTEGWPEFEISVASASVSIDYLRWIIIKKSGCKLIGGTALGRYGELCVVPRAVRTGRPGSGKRVVMRTSCSFERREQRLLLLLWCLWISGLPGKKI